MTDTQVWKFFWFCGMAEALAEHQNACTMVITYIMCDRLHTYHGFDYIVKILKEIIFLTNFELKNSSAM